MNNDLMFSSEKDDWATPQDFFDGLDREFHFTLDPCANAENTKCKNYYTKEQDGLSKDWGGQTVFCNPPYGRKSTGNWIRKCYEESLKPNTTVVALIPARTDTKAFHEYILGKSEIRFVRGRIRFEGADFGAPFPSMVIIFNKEGMLRGIRNNETPDMVEQCNEGNKGMSRMDKEKEDVARRAVHIAAVVMQAAGLCRYDDCGKCRKYWLPDDKTCVGCIEKWLLTKARKEIRT